MLSWEIPEQATLPVDHHRSTFLHRERFKLCVLGKQRWTRWVAVILVGLLLVGIVLISVALAKDGSFLSSSSNSSPENEPESNQGDLECDGLDCRPVDISVTASTMPTLRPSKDVRPTSLPTAEQRPSFRPSSAPVPSPSMAPTMQPTKQAKPTFGPSQQPTTTPTSTPTYVDFNPGELTVLQNDLLLSKGLTSRLLATTGQHVQYANNGFSAQPFHRLPDFGATFPDPENPGGWIYVSNSEVRLHEGAGQGGVGAFTFNGSGDLVNYKTVLNGTTANCGGGRTAWNAWISCEEYGGGRVWQVDPTGLREPQVITLGSDGGVFESFAYDMRNLSTSAFFVTEDHVEGALQRFRPYAPNWNDPWSILLGPGIIDFLVLNPTVINGTEGTFQWTKDRALAKASASQFYPNSEGIDVHDGFMYFISKRHMTMITLDLDMGKYWVESTRSGLFNGGPDQIKRILNDDSNLLFFTEDGGRYAGIHARNENGDYLTILESPTHWPETTGLGFSPDGRAMYVSYQGDGSPQALESNKVGYLYEIRRDDGLPFYGRSLNVHYHS